MTATWRWALGTAAILVACLGARAQVAGTDYVWWEAEAFKTSTFPAKHAFDPENAEQAAMLSGGKWLGNDRDSAKPLVATYEVTVPAGGADGTWHLYARKFWKHGPFSWTMSSGLPGVTNRGSVTGDVALMDDVPMRVHVGANWVALGDVKLAAGKQTFRIELAEKKGAAAFDCFVLTREPFVPEGKRKPGEASGAKEEGWFAFEPPVDRADEPANSLRWLNEKVAGERGWVRTKGAMFVQGVGGGNDKPVRFWAVNTPTESLRKDPASIAAQARFWARRGVNLVRVHGGFWKPDLSPDLELIGKLQAYVAAMKAEGIYVYLSTYFPLWMDLSKSADFPGYKDRPFAIQYIDPKFQALQRAWLKAILETPNPAGPPLGKDPAVAMIECVNEDSFFFWTFKPYEGVPAPEMAILEKDFGVWAAKRFGSLDAALKKWNGQAAKGDDVAAGRLGFLGLWEIANQKTPRGQATAEFLARHQKAYYEGLRDYLKKELGYAGLVSASNWQTADARVLGPLEKWSNDLDFLDRHGYWSGEHKGPRAGWSISAGDTYADASCLMGEGGPVNTPLWETQWLGKPSAMSEINWTPPNRFRAEYSFLAATYGTMLGNDAWFSFAASASGWEAGWSKFGVQTPAVAGQWPAAALVYRAGLVKEAPAAVSVKLKLADLLALKGGAVMAETNNDPNRFAGAPAAKVNAGGIDPLYFLLGKVEEDIVTDGATKAVELGKYVDREKKTATSMTGELAWDYGRGIVRLTAPSAVGAAGFLSKQPTIDLGEATLASGNDYGAVMLVALDGQPVAASKRLLLQVVTEEKPFGFKAGEWAGEGTKTIESTGGGPMMVRNIAGSLKLRTPARVTPLDLAGYTPRDAKPGLATDTVPFASDRMYYLLER